MNPHRSRTASLPRLGLVAALSLGAALAGCSSKTPETDNAVVTPDPAVVKPAPTPAPASAPDADAKAPPKG